MPEDAQGKKNFFLFNRNHEQQIAELLRQNQELIRALQIRDHSSSHKVTVQFENFDEETCVRTTWGSLIPLGYVTVGVQYKNQEVNWNLYIVKENLDTILGREWLYKIHLDWPAIKAIRAKTKQNLNNLLREYKDIFDDKLGEISNYEAKLKLRPGVKPIFCRVRTVPFALKGRVENEIDRLEREGIIEKVESSEWATPVVPVVKTDGSIRLCADYSVTLNPKINCPSASFTKIGRNFC
ncbi:retrovirus-related Pol polyprotein from transposon 412 [Trichonephila clavata]|uniref:Retrovirus-related Pol polyprotein from transposon 412 n=1 Tax=Trichonephila clavata TaxID=2740835 RepID=A0A8X6KPK8_TRICU|nr:retrovirus-related Pol polyprotein from transposon 412 [Trichonephila clavata]